MEKKGKATQEERGNVRKEKRKKIYLVVFMFNNSQEIYVGGVFDNKETANAQNIPVDVCKYNITEVELRENDLREV